MGNYWIFQANPAKYFILPYWLIHHAWKQPPGFKDWWGVEKGFDGQFHRGDVAFLWKCVGEPDENSPGYAEYEKWADKTGWKKRNKGRGIYAVVSVTGGTERKPPPLLPGEEKYFVDVKRVDKEDYWVPFEYPDAPREWKDTRYRLIYNPVLWHDGPQGNPRGLKSLDGLEGLQEAFGEPRNGWNIKAFRLKHEEGVILWNLVFGGKLPPPL